MKEEDIQIITPDGYKALEEKLKFIEKDLKDALYDRNQAKAKGDLSENFEYKEAESRVNDLQGQREHISMVLKNSIISKNLVFNSIVLGATFILQNLETKEEETYKLVSVNESNILEGKISKDSNFGKVLARKKENEIFSFNLNSYKIIKIW